MTSESEQSIVDLMPTDRLLIPAWASCLSWAIGEKCILDRFLKETGMRYNPPKNVVEAMISKASGEEFEICRSFIVWFNANIWGGDLNEDSDA